MSAKAQHPWMIKDINPTGTANGPVGSANSTTTQWTKIYSANGYAFFIANDGVHGEEIWRTDGTAAGTIMLADINPGAGSTTFGSFYTVGNLLYFCVQKNSYTLDVTALWRTDGTTAGTYAIMTRTGGHNISSQNAVEENDGLYNNSTALGGYYYFVVADTLAPISYNGSMIQNVHSRIYKTDGTAAGTTVYYDAGMVYWANYTGGSYGTIDRVIAMGGELYIFGINNVSLTALLMQHNGGPSQNVISSGDGTSAPTVMYAPGGNVGAAASQAVNVNNNYLLITGYWGGNGNATSLYRLKPGETTPVLLEGGSGISLFANIAGGSLETSSSYYASEGTYFFSVNSLPSVTNGEPAGTFAISGIPGGSALYTGLLNSKMTFYANDDKLYSWDGASPTSYQVVSDSLTGKHINKVLQIAGRAYFLNNYGSYAVQTSDLSGAGCLSIYPGGFLGSGKIINNNYVDFAFGVDGSFNAGNEPYLLNTTFKLFTAAVSNDWNTAGNWLPNGIPTASNDVVVPSLAAAKAPVINGNAACRNLTMSNAALTINTGANLYINGSIAKYKGTIKGPGSINIKGPAAKLYGLSGYPLTFNLFDVANVNLSGTDLSFATPINTINSVVNFQTNNKILAPYTTLTFTKKPYVTGYNNNRYIVTTNTVTFYNSGPYTNADSSLTIPLGTTATSYTPASFEFTPSSNMSFSAKVTDSVNRTDASGSVIQAGILNKKWTLFPGALGNIKITLGWSNGADELTGFNRNASFIAHSVNNIWTTNTPQAAFSGNSIFTVHQKLSSYVASGDFIVSSTADLSPSLSKLTINTGVLSPAFNPATTTYSTSVPYATNSIVLTPAAPDMTTIIKVNGTTVTSGTASDSIALNVGANMIKVITTSADGSAAITYSINVTRLALTAPVINYANSTQTYTTGTAITPLAPVATGVAAQAYGSAVTIGAGFGHPLGLAVDAAGNVYVPDYASHAVYEILASNGSTTTVATGLNTPVGVAVDAAGNVYVADNGGGTATVKEIPVGGGGIITLASGFRDLSGVAVDTRGNVYVAADADANGALTEIPAGGGATVALGSGFSQITGVAVDAVNNVYVTNNGSTTTIKEILASNGTVVTLASDTYSDNITIDGGGNVYFTNYHLGAIQEIPDGGGAAYSLVKGLSSPWGIALNGAGTIFYSQEGDSSVYKISPVGGYYIAPVLPAGLIFNNITGVISGTPTVMSPATTYTVTGYNSAGSTTASVNIKITANSVATLSALKMSNGTLTPAFAASTSNYTTSVTNTVNSITIKPTTTDPTAMVKINGIAVVSGTASTAIALAEGTTTAIDLVVTAQNGVTTKTYTITVTRAASSVTTLASLHLSNGALSPVFASGTTGYSASVGNTVASVTVTAKLSDATATLTVNGNAVTSNTPSGAIALAPGPNTINVVVTAQDGVTTKTYTITVTRAFSSNASLSALSLNTGSLSPKFIPATTRYAEILAASIAAVRVKPVSADANATIKVNGVKVTSGAASPVISLNADSTVITTTVTAADGITIKTYSITVTRPSTNANLAALSLNTGSLSPAFDAATSSYTETVPNTVTAVRAKPITADAGATVKVNGATVKSGGSSAAIALNVGTNTVTTIVTAQDGATTKTYTITVTRAAGPLNQPLQAAAFEKPVENEVDGVTINPAISPNGDGQNDHLIIDGISNYPDNKISIMSRSGFLVYEANGYNNSTHAFDGHSNKNGKMQQPGTYFYSLAYKVKGVTKYKTGFIVLKY